MFCDNYFPVSSENFNLHADGSIKGFPKLLGNDYATEIIYLTNQIHFSHFYSTSFRYTDIKNLPLRCVPLGKFNITFFVEKCNAVATLQKRYIVVL